MPGKVPKSTEQGEAAAVSGSQEVGGKLEFWGPRDQGVRKGKPGAQESEAGGSTDGQKYIVLWNPGYLLQKNGQLLVCFLDYVSVTRQRKAIL